MLAGTAGALAVLIAAGAMATALALAGDVHRFGDVYRELDPGLVGAGLLLACPVRLPAERRALGRCLHARPGIRGRRGYGRGSDRLGPWTYARVPAACRVARGRSRVRTWMVGRGHAGVPLSGRRRGRAARGPVRADHGARVGSDARILLWPADGPHARYRRGLRRRPAWRRPDGGRRAIALAGGRGRVARGRHRGSDHRGTPQLVVRAQAMGRRGRSRSPMRLAGPVDQPCHLSDQAKASPWPSDRFADADDEDGHVIYLNRWASDGDGGDDGSGSPAKRRSRGPSALP